MRLPIAAARSDARAWSSPRPDGHRARQVQPQPLLRRQLRRPAARARPASRPTSAGVAPRPARDVSSDIGSIASVSGSARLAATLMLVEQHGAVRDDAEAIERREPLGVGRDVAGVAAGDTRPAPSSGSAAPVTRWTNISAAPASRPDSAEAIVAAIAQLGDPQRAQRLIRLDDAARISMSGRAAHAVPRAAQRGASASNSAAGRPTSAKTRPARSRCRARGSRIRRSARRPSVRGHARGSASTAARRDPDETLRWPRGRPSTSAGNEVVEAELAGMRQRREAAGARERARRRRPARRPAAATNAGRPSRERYRSNAPRCRARARPATSARATRPADRLAASSACRRARDRSTGTPSALRAARASPRTRRRRSSRCAVEERGELGMRLDRRSSRACARRGRRARR